MQFAKTSSHLGLLDFAAGLQRRHEARTTVDGRVLLGIENFSMCKREASYVANPNWQLGFSVIYLDSSSGDVQWFPVKIDRRGFLWNGRFYRQ